MKSNIINSYYLLKEDCFSDINQVNKLRSEQTENATEIFITPYMYTQSPFAFKANV